VYEAARIWPPRIGSDVYNPIDPSGVEERLRDAGFSSVDVRTNEFGWAATAVPSENAGSRYVRG
jgi:hypothetical protein